MAELRKFKGRHGNFPEEVYIQIDGGSENANSAMLGMMEVLVAKRFARVITLTRLPVGHTHEDIDGCFAHIWNWMKTRPVLTLDEYKVGIEEAFRSTALNPTVTDVYVIPGYTKFVEDCVDPSLGQYAKMGVTQHQWRFEAVGESLEFPLGCKVLYRAYSSDRVIEMVSKPKSECFTPVGQVTGLEPVTTHVKWYPDGDTFQSRPGVEGFYLLKEMPSIPVDSLFPPGPFAPDCGEAFEYCVDEVFKRAIEWTDPVREWWSQWYAEVCPKAMTSLEYIENHPYDVPFVEYFYHQDDHHVPFRKVSAPWSYSLPTFRNVFGDIQFPPLVAAAVASVVCQFQKQAPPPRVYVDEKEAAAARDNNDSTILEFYLAKSQEFYAQMEEASKDSIIMLAARKINHKGETVVKTAFNKSNIVNRVREFDKITFLTFFKPLLGNFGSFVVSLTQPLPVEDDEHSQAKKKEVVVKLQVGTKCVKMTREQFGCMHRFNSITPLAMEYIMCAMQIQEQTRKEGYYEHHKNNKKVPQTLSVCKYLPPNFFPSQRQQNSNESSVLKTWLTEEGTYRIFLPIHGGSLQELRQEVRDSAVDFWSVIVLDRKRKVILYFDPKISQASQLTTGENNNPRCIMNLALQRLLHQPDLRDTFATWTFEVLQPGDGDVCKYPVCENDFDNGICAVLYMKLLTYDLPILYRANDLERFRTNLAFEMVRLSEPTSATKRNKQELMF